MALPANANICNHGRASEIWNYQQIGLGFNYRITELQAALGLSQLSRLNSFVKRRHEIAKRYDQAFSELPIILPWQHHAAWSSYHLYPIRIRKELCGTTQRQVYDAFFSADIGVNLHYIPVYRQPYYEAMGFQAGYCPEAELYHKEGVSLPMFPTLTAEKQEYVIDCLLRILNKR